MSSRSQKTTSSLQMLQSSVKWHHMEHIATIIVDVYSELLAHQSLILAMNSSYEDPLQQFENQLQIIESSFKMVFAMPYVDNVSNMNNSNEDTEDLKNLCQNILNLFEDILLILVSEDLYKIQILKEMIMWMNKDSWYLQERVMVIISRVLSLASKKAQGCLSIDAPCLGVLVAELCLLCSHDDPFIAREASLGLYHLLSIAQGQNEYIEEKPENCPKHVSHSFLPSPSDLEFLQDKTKVTQIIGQILSPLWLTDFVWSLLEKVWVPERRTAPEAASILKLTLEHHSQKVTAVPRILDAIYKQLSKNPSHIMKHVMLRVITLLTRTSPRMIIFKLLDYPVPADNTLVLMWHAVGLESRTASQVLKTILLILKGKTGDMKNALTERHFSLDDINMMPLAASQALCTLLPIDSYRKAMIHFFPQLLMALMFQHSCSSRMRPLEQDSPLYARDALRVLLNCSGLQQVDAALQKKNCWEQYGQVQYHHHGVYLIAKTLSDYKFQQFPETLHYLYKLSIGGPRTTEDRVIIIIFLTELLNNFLKDPFPEEFLILYRKWANDSSPTVSKLSLQKIASMAPVINEIESSCSMLTSILDALLSKDNMVVMQALLTLRELLDKLDRVKYSSLGIRITSSYLLLMDHISENIRSTAIRHFGLLVKDMSLNKQMLKHVVLKGLVPLILFLEESEIKVVKACKYTLEICDSHLQWSTSYFLQDEYYNFELVVLSICNTFLISQRNYITDLIGDTLGFLRSSRTYLRRAAVILIGYLAKAGDYLLLRDEIEVMLEVMEPMLQDEDLVVRELAEKTHKLFKEIAQGMTSSTIKRNFKKLVKFTYVKKLKPLYYYYQPEDQTECPTQIAKTKDKESLIEEKDENIMVKN